MNSSLNALSDALVAARRGNRTLDATPWLDTLETATQAYEVQDAVAAALVAEEPAPRITVQTPVLGLVGVCTGPPAAAGPEPNTVSAACRAPAPHKDSTTRPAPSQREPVDANGETIFMGRRRCGNLLQKKWRRWRCTSRPCWVAIWARQRNCMVADARAANAGLLPLVPSRELSRRVVCTRLCVVDPTGRKRVGFLDWPKHL